MSILLRFSSFLANPGHLVVLRFGGDPLPPMPIGSPTVWANFAANYENQGPVMAVATIEWLNPKPIAFETTAPWLTELPSLMGLSWLMPVELPPLVVKLLIGQFVLKPELHAGTSRASWILPEMQWCSYAAKFSAKARIESGFALITWCGLPPLNQQVCLSEWIQKPISTGQFTGQYHSVDAMHKPYFLPYGPTPSRWLCSDNYRPQTGRAMIRFAADSSLRFTPSPMVCVYLPGGGYKGNVPATPVIDSNLPIEPQVQKAYIMQPTLDCIRVRDNQRIIINSFSVSHSRGQFAQAISCEFSSRIDAERAKNELLKWTVNGYEFFGLVEQFSKRTVFGDEIHSGTGRSRCAELAAPYNNPISYTNMAARSFAGVLQDLLQFSDWTVELTGITDFNVPARAFSTSGKPPIESVNDAITQLGCMMYCDDESRRLNIVPRWPVSPWLTGVAAPDIVVHDAVILEQSETDQISPLCDSVFVRGEQVGVSAKVRRQGTAGVLPAADINSALIVDVQAARLAGSAAIADTGNKRLWQLALPVMASLPPFRIGQLIGVRVGTEVFKATCDNVSLRGSVGSDGAIDISQSVSLIESME